MANESLNKSNFISVTSEFFCNTDYFVPDKRLTLKISEIDKNNLEKVLNKILKIYGRICGQLIVNQKVFSLGSFSADMYGNFENGTIEISPIHFTECKRHDFCDLLLILKRLRSKDGCEWDKAQTHKSIRMNLIEEAYELLEGIELKDAKLMEEECGDVILQSVFHSAIEEEKGGFDIYDVLTRLCEKLITRHTHIFGEDKAKDASEALQFWEKAKGKEKNATDYLSKIKRIAKTLPALAYSEKVQNTAAKAGLDFSSAEEAFDKIIEEAKECRSCLADDLEEECGDLLFSVVNFLRLKNIDAEIVLMKACDKFIGRFERLSELADRKGIDIKKSDPKTLDDLWQEIKKQA